MGYIVSDRDQATLFATSLNELVEEDARVRYIIKIVDELDLRILHSRYSSQGTSSYDPKIMLCIIFLSFTESIFTTRDIERYCKKHVDFMYAACNQRPDHSTIARFIQHNIDLMPKLFVQIVRLAKEKGYSNFKEIAIDGSKIKSTSSKKKSYQESKLERYLSGIEEEIKKYLEKMKEEESEEKIEEIKKAVDGLKKKEAVIKVRKAELSVRKTKLKKERRESHQINIVEPEAYMMDMGYGKGYSPAYNTQISVDMGTHFIASMDVLQDRNDSQTFSEQHKKTEETLGKAEETETRKYVTDNGYWSFDQLEYIKNNNIDAYIYETTKKQTKEELQKTDRRVAKNDFEYNAKNDCYICPMGKELNFYGSENSKSFKGKKYRTDLCKNCEIKNQCFSRNNKNGIKELRRNEKQYLADEMRDKLNDDKAEILFFKRKTSVEPVFGNIKHNMKFDRFNRRGLKNVRGEFALVCIAHNLKNLCKQFRGRLPVLSNIFITRIGILLKNSFSRRYTVVSNF